MKNQITWHDDALIQPNMKTLLVTSNLWALGAFYFLLAACLFNWSAVRGEMHKGILFYALQHASPLVSPHNCHPQNCIYKSPARKFTEVFKFLRFTPVR